jgi:hypothetical protein
MAFSCWLCACAGGTETGNPSFTGTLEYNAYTTNAAQVALRVETSDPEPSALVVDEAWLVLGDVGFYSGASGTEDAGACDPSTEAAAHSKGIGPGDHAAEAFATADITLAAGDYCGVRVPFEPASAARVAELTGAPEALAGHSIVITGTLPDGRAFELRSASEHEVFLSADDAAFEMSREAGNVLIGFDVAQWLSPLDFSAATVDADGVVYVDGERNPQLLSAFDAQVASGTALFRDPDDDGAVKTDSVRLASASE